MVFRSLQKTLIDQFHDPVYRWKVRQWIDDDPILEAAAKRTGIDVFGHLFHPPTWDYIEPSKDATADLIQTRNLLISQRRRCARHGFSWDDLSTEIVEDNASLIRKAWLKAEELNKEFPGLAVTWREVACLPTPDGFTAQLPSDGTAGAASPKKPDETEDTADDQ